MITKMSQKLKKIIKTANCGISETFLARKEGFIRNHASSHRTPSFTTSNGYSSYNYNFIHDPAITLHCYSLPSWRDFAHECFVSAVEPRSPRTPRARQRKNFCHRRTAKTQGKGIWTWQLTILLAASSPSFEAPPLIQSTRAQNSASYAG